MKNLILLIFVAFLNGNFTFAQWITYTTESTTGIPGTIVSSITKGVDGKIWIGTDAGVASYDVNLGMWKLTDENSGLQNSFIYEVFRDNTGKIWAATNGGGVSVYSAEKWSTITVNDGLSSNVVRAVSQSTNGKIWLGTYGKGICYYSPSSGVKKLQVAGLTDSYVLSLLALGDSVLMMGSLDRGIFLIRDTTYTQLSLDDGLVSNLIYCFYSAGEGKIWAGTGLGAQEIDLTNGTISTCPDSLKDKNIYTIGRNKQGDMIFGTTGKVYREDNGSWQAYVPGGQGVMTSYYSMLFDNQGVEWFGTLGNGLFMSSGADWLNFYNSDGLHDYNYVSVCEDSRRQLWFAGYNQIYRFDGLNWKAFGQSDGLPSYGFQSVVADKNGNVWTCSPSYGLYKYDDTLWTRVDLPSDGQLNYNLYRLFADAENNIWAGGYNNIFKYNGTSWERFIADGNSIPYNVSAFAEMADGRILVGSYDGILGAYDGKNWSKVNVPATLYSILSLAVDQAQNIWLATQNGIIKYDGLNTTAYFRSDRWDYFYCIRVDPDGDIWSGMDYGGIRRYTGDKWLEYHVSNGLPSETVNDIFFDSRGRTWVAGYNGIGVAMHVSSIHPVVGPLAPEVNMFPNPFNDRLTVRLNAENTGFLRVTVYSVDGRPVLDWSDKITHPGLYMRNLETDGLKKGMYVCRIIYRNKQYINKITKTTND